MKRKQETVPMTQTRPYGTVDFRQPTNSISVMRFIRSIATLGTGVMIICLMPCVYLPACIMPGMFRASEKNEREQRRRKERSLHNERK